MSAESSCAKLARLIRRHNKESQVSLAKRMGVCRTYISKIERRQYMNGASINFVRKFCAAYGMDVREFLLIAEAMDGKWKGES